MNWQKEILSETTSDFLDRICVTNIPADKNMSIQTFAREEKYHGPLNSVLHARFPDQMASLVKTAALVEGVSESTVLRFALDQWAKTEGMT